MSSLKAGSLFALAAACSVALSAQPVRVAIAGLDHGHVSGFFHALEGRTEVQLVGVYGPDPVIAHGYAQEFHLDPSMLYTNLDSMLDHVKPEAVAIFSNTYDHTSIVETCAAHHVGVIMMEKPLAVGMKEARRIQRAAENSGAQIIVNYETSWYRSHAAIWRMMHEEKQAGPIRRIVAEDGHEGPKEIHVQPEFLAWLSDPVRNGAGALFDFGCYGANLMTWLMDNERPVAVTAVTKTMKPGVYPNVDDDATVIVEYAHMVGVIEASWNWPFSRKDLEVYAQRGYAIAQGYGAPGEHEMLTVRMPGDNAPQTPALEPLPADAHDSISYLASVTRGKFKPSGLSSLDNNMIVTEILEAARDSARSGKKILLH